MRKVVKIVEEAEYESWLAEQKSHYEMQIKGNKGIDPYFEAGPKKGSLEEQSLQFTSTIEAALKSDNEKDKVIRLDHVTFETGKARLTTASMHELNDLVKILTDFPKVTIEVAGHTDNKGKANSNMVLSTARAKAVSNYLVEHGIDGKRLESKGYGQTVPVADNETEEGRQQNRRTEFKILTQ